MLMLTSFRLQVIVAAAVVVRQRAVVHQQVALARQQAVVVVARQQVVVVQWAVALLQAVPQAFAGKIQQTELCLPIQVAPTFSFHLPPNEFCSFLII
jgi:hypothetical protein